MDPRKRRALPGCLYISLNWYEPIGSGPGLDEEKEVTFDNVQELGKFLKQNPGLAEKVGYPKIIKIEK